MVKVLTEAPPMERLDPPHHRRPPRGSNRGRREELDRSEPGNPTRERVDFLTDLTGLPIQFSEALRP